MDRKWDYASWDTNGDPVTCSRYFKFENVEIVIYRQYIYIRFCEEGSETCNKAISIESGLLIIDSNYDRIKILVTENNRKGIYVSLIYYKNYHIWNKSEKRQDFYIMSKYSYNKERWEGINMDDMNEFYNTIKKHTYIEFPYFKNIVKEYENKNVEFEEWT